MEDDSTEPPFHTDADHREFVSAGAAAGLAVRFAAHGGVERGGEGGLGGGRGGGRRVVKER